MVLVEYLVNDAPNIRDNVLSREFSSYLTVLLLV